MILIGSRYGYVSLPEESARRVHVRDVIYGLPQPDGEHRGSVLAR